VIFNLISFLIFLFPLITFSKGKSFYSEDQTSSLELRFNYIQSSQIWSKIDLFSKQKFEFSNLESIIDSNVGNLESISFALFSNYRYKKNKFGIHLQGYGYTSLNSRVLPSQKSSAIGGGTLFYERAVTSFLNGNIHAGYFYAIESQGYLTDGKPITEENNLPYLKWGFINNLSFQSFTFKNELDFHWFFSHSFLFDFYHQTSWTWKSLKISGRINRFPIENLYNRTSRLYIFRDNQFAPLPTYLGGSIHYTIPINSNMQWELDLLLSSGYLGGGTSLSNQNWELSLQSYGLETSLLYLGREDRVFEGSLSYHL
tara:strand:+ start:1108 stop:2049 length:942 start_codon:yes stop_codon:yes gene_type:complete